MKNNKKKKEFISKQVISIKQYSFDDSNEVMNPGDK